MLAIEGGVEMGVGGTHLINFILQKFTSLFLKD